MRDNKGHKLFDPSSGQIFVFGSNAAGFHGAGAALYAKKWLGAIQGMGHGPMPSPTDPKCYAIPTKDAKLRTLSLGRIAFYVDRFLAYAREHPDLRFFVSRLGTGLAGLEDKEMAPLFKEAPPNCELHYNLDA